MSTSTLLLMLSVLSAAGYFMGRRKALDTACQAGGIRQLHSRPAYYAALTAIWCAIPALLVISFWHAFQDTVIVQWIVADLPEPIRTLPADRLNLVINDIKNIAAGHILAGHDDPAMVAAAGHYRSLLAVSDAARAVAALSLACPAMAAVLTRINPSMRARNHVEQIIRYLITGCSAIAVLITIGIVLSVICEAIRFFRIIPVTEFLFGLKWSPQTAIRADQVGSSGAFGAVPVLLGTAMISLIAMVVSVPIGLMSAIYLSEYAGLRFRAVVKPLIEILAGVPTVVYGFFAALTVAPLIRSTGAHLGLSVSSESALAAGLVMGIMIIPFVCSLSDDFINAVPRSLRDGSYSLGATRSETIRKVLLPAALPGIVGGVLLAASRAIGETMIVVMAAGLAANLTVNPLAAVTTVTVQIVTLLVGDQEFDSAKTLAAFALGLLLFVITLLLNIVALGIVRKYRQQYE